MRRAIGVAAIMMVAMSLGAAAEAQEWTPTGERVAQWREGRRVLGEAFSVGYAQGVLTFGDLYFACARGTTIGELEAFLLYGADPKMTVQQAIIVDAGRRGCRFKTAEEHRKTLGLEGAR